MPNPSELERAAQEANAAGFNPRMQDMTMDIHERLRIALGAVLTGFLDEYEPITYDAEFSEVEHKGYDGFIPFTDGGFHTLVLYPAK
jgi:hypothetical protein